MEQMISNATIFSVTPNSAGTKWVTSGRNAKAFSEEYHSKEVAIAAARVRARGNRPSEVRVYARDGTVEFVRTYGLDDSAL
jgi:hypothetical protein